MTSHEKKSLIARFEQAAVPLLDELLAAPGSALDYRPNLKDAWTIREHAVHFLDADIFAYGDTVLEETVQGIRLMRKLIADSARSLLDRDWDSLFVYHPKRGTMTVDDILKLYEEHAAFHLEYIRRNLKASN